MPDIDAYKQLILGDVPTQFSAFPKDKVDIIGDVITLEKRNPLFHLEDATGIWLPSTYK